jgi:hypothetical protein
MAKAKRAARAKTSKGGKWIQSAIKHPGALTKQAGGQSPLQFAKAHRHASGTLGKRSRLAITLSKLPRHHGPRSK